MLCGHRNADVGSAVADAAGAFAVVATVAVDRHVGTGVIAAAAGRFLAKAGIALQTDSPHAAADLADARIVERGAIGIGAALVGIEANSVADSRAGGTAKLFAVTLAVAAGVVAALGLTGWAASGAAFV